MVDLPLWDANLARGHSLAYRPPPSPRCTSSTLNDSSSLPTRTNLGGGKAFCGSADFRSLLRSFKASSGHSCYRHRGTSNPACRSWIPALSWKAPTLPPLHIFHLVREIYDNMISAVTLATGHNDPFVPSFPAKIRFRAPETPPFCHPCYRIIGWMNSEHLANERVPVQLSDTIAGCCNTSWQPCIYSIAQCSNCLEHPRTTIPPPSAARSHQQEAASVVGNCRSDCVLKRRAYRPS